MGQLQSADNDEYADEETDRHSANYTKNESWTNESQEYGVGITDELSVQVTFGLAYCAIFFVGLFGNALVVTAVLRAKRMRTTTNLLISNLALSDIIFTAFALFTPYATFFPYWPFGDTLCRIIAMTSCCTVFVSSFTSTVIAIDRYFRIVHPLMPRLKVRYLPLVIVFIWLASIAVSSPLAFAHGISETGDGNYICNEKWPTPTHRHVFGSVTFCLQFIVPSIIITFCYARVLRRITERLLKRSLACTRNPQRELHELRHKHRMTRMLLAMVGQFAGCWIFFNLYHFLDDLIALQTKIDYDQYTLGFLIVYTIASSSVVYNPFIYGWMNENFRKEFTKMFSCIFKHKHRHVPIATASDKSRAHSYVRSHAHSHLKPIAFVLVAAENDENCDYDRTTHGLTPSYVPSPSSPLPTTPVDEPLFAEHSANSNQDKLLLKVSLSVISVKQDAITNGFEIV